VGNGGTTSGGGLGGVGGANSDAADEPLVEASDDAIVDGSPHALAADSGGDSSSSSTMTLRLAASVGRGSFNMCFALILMLVPNVLVRCVGLKRPRHEKRVSDCSRSLVSHRNRRRRGVAIRSAS